MCTLKFIPLLLLVRKMPIFGKTSHSLSSSPPLLIVVGCHVHDHQLLDDHLHVLGEQPVDVDLLLVDEDGDRPLVGAVQQLALQRQMVTRVDYIRLRTAHHLSTKQLVRALCCGHTSWLRCGRGDPSWTSCGDVDVLNLI